MLFVPSYAPARVLAALALAATAACSAADFNVTTPGFYYSINGQSPNPTLTLVRGRTYTFAVNAGPTHPFQILSAGVQNNNVSVGTITFTVPMAVSNYTYICSLHRFGGQIITVDPPPPPRIELLGLSLSNRLVLWSTGTNGWRVLPEFNTNLATTNWFGLTVISNFYSGGTNETLCGVPPGTNVFIRVRSIAN